MASATFTFDEVQKGLDDHICVIQETWLVYRQLFGTTEDRVDLLNAFVPGFAGTTQRVLLDDVILAICRLFDHPAMSGNENLSLSRLVESLDPKPDEAQAKAWAARVNAIKTKANALMARRHKRIAHNDIAIKKLPDVTRQLIEEVLLAIRELLNEFHPQPISYECIDLLGDGDALIQDLQMAGRLRELQTEAHTNPNKDDVIQKLRNRTLPKL